MVVGLKADAGLSLFESLVSLLIISLILGISAPVLLPRSDCSSLNASVSQIISELRLLQANAMKFSSTQLARFQRQNDRLIFEANERTVQLPERATLEFKLHENAQSDRETIVISFFANGQSAGGSLEFRCEHETAGIQLGRIIGDVTQIRP